MAKFPLKIGGRTIDVVECSHLTVDGHLDSIHIFHLRRLKIVGRALCTWFVTKKEGGRCVLEVDETVTLGCPLRCRPMIPIYTETK